MNDRKSKENCRDIKLNREFINLMKRGIYKTLCSEGFIDREMLFILLDKEKKR